MRKLLFMSVTMAGALAVAAPCAAPAAEAATFTLKPTATRVGHQVRIDFAVSAETDVAVYVEDGAGKIIRHVAAGALGRNAPPPLKPNSLAQSIAWDGTDDDGRAAPAGAAARVRVGLGLTASLDGLAFAEKDNSGPNRIDTIAGLAVGPDGKLYMMDKWAGLCWWFTHKIRVFNRDGSYLKTIKPFPSDLPIERVKAAGVFVNSFGHANPLIYRPEGTAFYPQEEVPQQPAITADGRILFATRSNISDYDAPRFHVAMLDGDGGVPEGAFDGPALKTAWASNPCLAVSGDGKRLYLTGVQTARSRQAANAVYAVNLPERSTLDVLFGEPASAGADTTHLSNPRSVAVDRRGHLLVADFGNNRVVAVNESDKTFAGSFAVDAPSWVAVHSKTGDVYVCSKQTTLIKFAAPAKGNYAEVKEVARADLSGLLAGLAERYRVNAVVYWALDGTTDPAVVWAGNGAKLVRCEDRGTTFSEPTPADCKQAKFFFRPAADPTRQEIVCRIMGANYDNSLQVLNETTGAVRTFGKSMAGIEGRTHRLGPDGSIYAEDHGSGLVRYDRDGKPKPFEATANDAFLQGRIPAGNTGTTMWERDFWVDRKNDIYVRVRGPAYHGQMDMVVYDQQGRLKRTVLYAVSDGMFGPRVDAQGNLYIMEIVKPLGEKYPAEFEGRLKGRAAGGYETMHWYDWIYGSIVKFGPQGGAVWFGPGWLSNSSPLNYEGWRAATEDGRSTVVDLKTTGGALTGTVARRPAKVTFPYPGTLNAADVNRVVVRLKNGTDGTQATFYYHLVGESYMDSCMPGKAKTVTIAPNSDFAEYTFDLSGEKDWKGHVYNLSLVPTSAAAGTFAIDWVRLGEPGQTGARRWDFNAEDSQETKLPATLKKEKVGSYMCPQGAELQGAIWMRPGFSHVGQCSNNDHCHCAGTDFDMDDFGRIFAPDTGRFRVGVLDANGNELVSFGRYGNQDCTGPEIAFGWIIGVAVTDRYAYVDDLMNKRILRVRLGYASEETCALR